MARLNIENDLFKDNRFTNLCILMGSRRLALGALVECWAYLQDVADPENPTAKISISEWRSQELAEEIIKAKLASIENDLVEVVGARKHFSWIVQKKAAGRKGGLKRAENQKHETGESDANELSPATPRLAESSAANPLTLTLALPLTQTLAPSQELQGTQPYPKPTVVDIVKAKRATKVETDSGLDLRRRTWEAYAEAYAQRYHALPVRNKESNSKIKSFVERIGEESPEVASFYLTHNQAWYGQKMHSLGLMLQDAEKLRTEWFTGKQTTTAGVRHQENKQQLINAFGKHLRGEAQ